MKAVLILSLITMSINSLSKEDDKIIIKALSSTRIGQVVKENLSKKLKNTSRKYNLHSLEYLGPIIERKIRLEHNNLFIEHRFYDNPEVRIGVQWKF